VTTDVFFLLYIMVNLKIINMKIGITDYNIEKEFNIYVKKVNRQFMYDRCRDYKVRIKKDDELPALCYKYLKKKRNMKPWEYPDDEDGNAVYLNRLVMLEDKIALYILYKKLNSMNKKDVTDEKLKNLKVSIKEFIISCIEDVEDTEARIRVYKKHKKVANKKLFKKV